MEGDIGGFGAGSKFAWELFPVLTADMGKHATMKAGYRVLGMNYQTGPAKIAYVGVPLNCAWMKRIFVPHATKSSVE